MGDPKGRTKTLENTKPTQGRCNASKRQQHLKMLRILQTNLGRRKKAQELLYQTITDLSKLENSFCTHKKIITVCGDFNARSPLWGDDVESPRGCLLSEFLSETKTGTEKERNAEEYIEDTTSSYSQS